MINSLKSNDNLKLSCRRMRGRIWTSFSLLFFRIVPSMLELHFLEELKGMNLLISGMLVSLPNQVTVHKIVSVPFLMQLPLCYSSTAVEDKLLPFSKSDEPYTQSPAKRCCSRLYKWQLVNTTKWKAITMLFWSTNSTGNSYFIMPLCPTR